MSARIKRVDPAPEPFSNPVTPVFATESGKFLDREGKDVPWE